MLLGQIASVLSCCLRNLGEACGSAEAPGMVEDKEAGISSPRKIVGLLLLLIQ